MDGTKVTGLRMWKVAPDHYSVSLTATSSGKNLKKLKSILQDFRWISHSSVEFQDLREAGVSPEELKG